MRTFFLFLLSSLFVIGCTGNGGDIQEQKERSEPSHQSRPAPPATVRPASFGSSQNDTLGYNGLSWGLTINEFLSAKKLSVRTPSKSSKPLRSAIDADVIAALLGTPLSSSFGYTEMQYQYVPQAFREIYVNADETHYIFFNDVFSMAFTQLDAKKYNLYLSDLESKYQKHGKESYTMSPAGPNDQHVVTATLFRRTNTNTRIYLIKDVYTVQSMGMQLTSVNLLYVPNHYFKEIKSEIGASVDRSEKAEKAHQQQRLEEDRKKIQ